MPKPPRPKRKLAQYVRPMHAPARKCERISMFARLWTGSLTSTLELCRAAGMVVSAQTAAGYLRQPNFLETIRKEQNLKLGSGIYTRDELQRLLTRISMGIEPDGFEVHSVKVQIIPGENDYDETIGGTQWRTEFFRTDKYFEGNARLKAIDMLGRTLGAFVDKLEVSGDLKVTVNDLLDDDLKGMIVDAEVVESPALPEPAQVPELEEMLA